MLESVNSKVVENMVENFISDGNGGNTLCELISKLEPDFIGMNEANGKSAGDQRIGYAKNIAEEEMNIPPIIDPKYMVVDEPDEFSVMAYISDYRNCETEKQKALGEDDELDFFASEQLSLFPTLLGADNVTLLDPLFRLLLNLP